MLGVCDGHTEISGDLCLKSSGNGVFHAFCLGDSDSLSFPLEGGQVIWACPEDVNSRRCF